jgi:hypothetical protein
MELGSIDQEESEAFLKILVGISSTGTVFNEDKSQDQWEKQMMLSWERLCESRSKRQLFSQVPLSKSSEAEQEREQAIARQFVQNDYIQLKNSYL